MTAAGRPADPEALDRYARSGHRRVDGWVLPSAIRAVRRLADTQARLGIRGPVAEIGVHHGRFFLLLHLLTSADERSVAYDLFESQQENVDASGHGDRAAFEANVRRHAALDERVVVRAANSLRLTVDGVLADAGGRVRLFSVDGGHTAGITANDLALAEATLCEGGLLVLDDFFNPSWPGVAEGACRHLFGPTALVPVVISGNKLVFTNGRGWADAYRADLLHLAADHDLSHQVFLDHPVTVVGDRPGSALRRAAVATPVWQAVRETALGRGLRRVLKGG